MRCAFDGRTEDTYAPKGGFSWTTLPDGRAVCGQNCRELLCSRDTGGRHNFDADLRCVDCGHDSVEGTWKA